MFLFAPITFITAAFTFVISIAMLVIALSQDTPVIGRPQAVRHAFFSILTLLSLMTSAASIVFLTHVGFRIWVFPDAQYEQFGYNYPPGLYINAPENGVPIKIDCKIQETCTLTDNQKDSIKTWMEDYKNWRSQNEITIRNRTHAINALSILIVALPIFFLSYTIMTRSFATTQKKSATQHVYYYGVSFTTLVMILVSVGLLVNALMNQLLLPEKKGNNPPFRPYDTTAIANVENVVACTEECSLPAEYKDLATQWQKDTQMFTDRQNTLNRYHTTYAVTLPIMLIASLIFSWHASLIRKRNQEEVSPTTAPTKKTSV
ncbi:MAG: hypothetical protein A3B74_05210 [Candidatus Kerfeldbacteria bacterium RIFCSPHIGHO2_02_FULL_42_14]|uniref:DUF5671 domain-containing protein n=1 Tax=Candidatus Kerfeldbacteria bacterium RIFCSPHIGHO2_02_FULL_42_14 TaxID=1798540 RepID=A0A1G2ASZ2_9BACT|nr:MAG: hypothetical protein A3B74_05210 [Candidatus Kerfeldbacteria bacterium RIFCSPHIGHO2_02_FULL_42_14]OGY81606.1 MAG: hypothetical protein A3E60_02040 [Candidatus Kerfeldbacteria bacterium RIFCSPHIGHO2_12_FULL_42_13]OGY83208.1 MAG: hypothetical protein A3I91_03445 [Candidatus Kerfeldbacteria bacterium RIFCSPLOWO2_02_FULL_42_19]OGY86239.1 MAG: hypothetical protein A3G01_00175 [Candidatus Kerfeldbacteria bacterium RIFCSPLOWO2_12_FULL_43_9]